MPKNKLWRSLIVLVIMGALILSACGSTADETEEAAPPEPESTQIEIYSWWAGDEGPALEALISEYNSMYPDVEVINATVAGGSGTEAKAVLKTRMLGGDPPDTFQVHAGQELIGTWVVADRMEDLTFLYEEQGWFDKYPAGLIALMNSPKEITGPINLGNPTEITVGSLAEAIISLTGSRSSIEHLPLPADDPVQRQPDIAAAIKHLGWEPGTELQAGLKRTITYFESLLSTPAA